ncbi:MAG: hypothetical protein U0103_16845 [Candidatus Obscuribacterales bacterium]
MVTTTSVPDIMSAVKSRLERGFSAQEILLEELAPRGIGRITTFDDDEIFPGESARFAANDRSYDFTISLTEDGLALIRSHVKGFFLHGGEAANLGRFGYDSLSRFEQLRRIVPLKVGRDVPLGVKGDWIFKPLPNHSIIPLNIERVPSPHQVIHLNINQTLLYTVRELTRQSGMLSSKHLGWYVKLAEALNVLTS